MSKRVLTFILLCGFAISVSAQGHVVSEQRMLDRLLSYIKIDSQSQYSNNPSEFPMTEGQKQMAQLLAKEAAALGAKVYHCPNQYIYVELPSNTKEEVPSLGISCHYDVSPEAPGGEIKATVVKYEGGAIHQGGNRYISPDSELGKHLKDHIGKTIIHSDGTTLLGGDDKTGCAIAMSLLESLLKSGKKIKHGKVQFVFCPNEDIGRSAEKIDMNLFNPDILFDLDGEGGEEVTVSNFTAFGFNVKFEGHATHPAVAKEMKFGDALAAASTFIASVPVKYRPEHSEGRQGYIHPYEMKPIENKQKEPAYLVSTRIRYFNKADGELFDSIVRAAVKRVQEEFPNVKTTVVFDKIQYENVEYTMHPKSKDVILAAAAKVSKKLRFVDGRGGSTSSMFCTRGLKGGMNVCSGQYAVHTTSEYAVLEDMYSSYLMMLEVVKEVAALK